MTAAHQILFSAASMRLKFNAVPVRAGAKLAVVKRGVMPGSTRLLVKTTSRRPRFAWVDVVDVAR
jgi:hypothetical protein